MVILCFLCSCYVGSSLHHFFLPQGVHWLSWPSSLSHLSNNTRRQCHLIKSTKTDRSSIQGGDGTETEHMYSLWDSRYWYESKWFMKYWLAAIYSTLTVGLHVKSVYQIPQQHTIPLFLFFESHHLYCMVFGITHTIFVFGAIQTKNIFRNGVTTTKWVRNW